MKKVVKFGGSSLASAEQFAKVGDIILADAERRYVVPSAPGKRFPEDTKVTDMLYECYHMAESGQDFHMLLSEIAARYQEIIEGLSLPLSLKEEFKAIEKNFQEKAGENYAASRGEYLNGIIMAAYLNFEFIDAAGVIRFTDAGEFDAELTNRILCERLEKTEHAVIPGFYGAFG
ncbi:MAG: aspartate kinase, partial [Lachnospiraceae bacterium]|nr:aspartate kinase [Lachnospiraceae bacterium]